MDQPFARLGLGERVLAFDADGESSGKLGVDCGLRRIKSLVNRLTQNEFRRAGMQENEDLPIRALAGKRQHVGDENFPRNDAHHQLAGKQGAADLAITGKRLHSEREIVVVREERKNFERRENSE